MRTGWESGTRAALGVILLIAVFLGVTVASDAALGRARLDLTENKLFTLSPGTVRILHSLKRPVKLTYYYSEAVARGKPGIQSYAKRVSEMLDEFRLRSDGKITIERVEPETFSESEDRAQRDGIRGVPLGQGEVLYLGLVATNDTDGREVIPFFDPTQERFLEYELARALSVLENPARLKVEIISTLPIAGVEPTPGADLSRSRPWQILRALGAVFEINIASEEFTDVTPGTDLLLVIHPKDLSEERLQAIERFILSGKPTIICEDPFSDADAPPNTSNPMAMMQHDRSSNLNAILSPWGLTMPPDKVVGDLDNAIRAPDPRGRGEVPYLQYISLRQNAFDENEAMLRGVTLVNLGTAGTLEFDASKGTTFTPIISSSPRSELIDNTRYELLMDPQGLLSSFKPLDKAQVLAGLLRGPAMPVLTAPVPQANPDGTPIENAPPPDGKPSNINVLVIADTDFLTDPLWIQESMQGMGQTQQIPVANNADLLCNAIEAMCGSADLVSVRARGSYSRPFTLVERIRRDAEQKFLARAQELQARESDVERRLLELLRGGAVDQNGRVLTPKVQEEYDRLLAERLQARADLRDVQYKLRKDVERLGIKVQIINTAAAPIAVALGALGLGAYKSARRRADRNAMAGQG